MLQWTTPHPMFVHFNCLKSSVLHVQPNMNGSELDQLRAVLLRHCDVNKDGKIQRNELALCLGVKR